MAQAEQNKAQAENEAEKQFRSSIAFPYGDLDDAVEFAHAVHAVGGQSCGIEQVAAYLKQSASSGAFRLRLSFPRVFGFTENERGTVSLTLLGQRVVDPKQEAAARVDAFLNVPLYKAIYEKYKSFTLPPPAALEREMEKLGVSPKQKDKARQVFDRSAKQAGFTWAGADRLVLPVLKDKGEEVAPPPKQKPLEAGTPGADKSGKGRSSGGGEPPDRTDMVMMLLRYLPESGLDNDQLARWLRAAEVNLRMAYNIGGSIKVEVQKDAGT